MVRNLWIFFFSKCSALPGRSPVIVFLFFVFFLLLFSNSRENLPLDLMGSLVMYIPKGSLSPGSISFSTGGSCETFCAVDATVFGRSVLLLQK